MAQPELSQTDFAVFVSLTTRQLRNLTAEGMPCRADGRRKWYGPDAIRWLRERDKEEIRANFTGEKASLARKLAADARMAELRVQQMEEELVLASEFRGALEGVLERLRARVVAIPGGWAPALVAFQDIPDMVDALERRADELLDSLRVTANDAAEALLNDPAEPAPDPPKKKAPRKRAAKKKTTKKKAPRKRAAKKKTTKKKAPRKRATTRKKK